jgi:predicted transcriptional regulator
MSDAAAEQIDFVSLTSDVVSAYLSNNHVQPDDLAGLIQGVHAKLSELASGGSGEPESVKKLTSAEIKRSITPEHLISFEDGKPYRTLRRHLSLRGLTPEEYRAKWDLPVDYPMTSASYSSQRSELARSLGLGRYRAKASDEGQSRSANAAE